ncbi:hypothetical protein OKA06_11700 [Novosphingobium sp. MW5]|nr:hypothetical protein [Novosphingobium sp. MW5]
MDRQTYLQELEKAYRDELVGHAIAEALLQKSGPSWPNQEIMRQMAQLEKATAEVLKPLILRHNLVDPDTELIRQEGVFVAQSTASWTELTAFFREALPPIVETFKQMLEACDEHDFGRIEFLVRHEIALLDLALAQDDGELACATRVLGGLIEERKKFADH